MSEAKHTPGPWMCIGTTPNEQIIREENGDVVAIVPHNMPRNEYEANARLDHERRVETYPRTT